MQQNSFSSLGRLHVFVVFGWVPDKECAYTCTGPECGGYCNGVRCAGYCRGPPCGQYCNVTGCAEFCTASVVRLFRLHVAVDSFLDEARKNGLFFTLSEIGMKGAFILFSFHPVYFFLFALKCSAILLISFSLLAPFSLTRWGQKERSFFTLSEIYSNQPPSARSERKAFVFSSPFAP